jgi:hypothetical protein
VTSPTLTPPEKPDLVSLGSEKIPTTLNAVVVKSQSRICCRNKSCGRNLVEDQSRGRHICHGETSADKGPGPQDRATLTAMTDEQRVDKRRRQSPPPQNNGPKQRLLGDFFGALHSPAAVRAQTQTVAALPAQSSNIVPLTIPRPASTGWSAIEHPSVQTRKEAPAVQQQAIDRHRPCTAGPHLPN